MPVLSGDAELDGEPVAGGQLLDVVVAGAQAGQANLLAELGKGGVSKERDVAEEFVTDVRLRCVHRGAVVSDVLGGVEHPEGEPGQEVSGGEKSGHRSQLEPGDAWQVKFMSSFTGAATIIITFQEVRNPLELRHFVLVVSAVLLQEGEHVVVLIAGVSLVKSLQIVEDSLPGGFLLRGVFNTRNLLSTREVCSLQNINKISILLFVEERDVSKFLSSFPVDRISKPRVIRVKLGSVRENLIGKLVQVLDLPGEPGHSFRVVFNVPGNHLEVA